MDFDKLFAGPAVLAKQLEARWEASSSSSSSSSPKCHEVPPALSAAAAQANESKSSEASAETMAGGDEKLSPAGAKTNKEQPTRMLRGARGGGDMKCGDDPASTSTTTATTTATRMNRPYLRRTLLYCRDPLDKNYFPLWKDKQRSADVGQELPQLDILAQLFGHDKPEEYNAALLEDKNTWQYHHVGHNGNGNKSGEGEAIDRCSNNSDGVSMNSSEENSFRDVSVLKTPPPRKRKRRITPTTTPASRSAAKKNRAGGRAPSTPESHVGDGGGADAVSSPSSSTSSSSSRQHTKLFFDVQMAQSPSKVLSPTTAEMKYGKAFPPYQPKDQATGKWIPPQKPRSAYELFVDSTRGQARLHLKRRDRNNQEKVDEQLEKLWANGNTTTVLYWKQEEEWDRQRYLHEKGLYTRAQQLAANYAKADDANSGRNGEHFSATATNRTCTIVPRRVANVYYHYFYHRNGLPVAQIEKRSDCRCPFCFENCITDVGCVMHCQIVHGDGLLSFHGMKDEEGILHIGIHSKLTDSGKAPLRDDQLDSVRTTSHQRGWDPANALQQKPLANARLENFVYSRRGTYGPRLTEVLFLKRPYTAAAALDVQDRKRKAQFLRDQGVGEDTVRRIVPNDEIPVRQYYHSKTNLPMRQEEWAEDSDDESDDSWIDKKSSLLIDEFDDVSEKEKYFLKLWNFFMNGLHKLVADRGIPSRCVEFIKVHGDDIAQRNMRDLLLLHLCNLWDEEILSSDHISALMTFFDRNSADATNSGKSNNERATRVLPRAAKSPNHRRKTPTKPGNSSQKSPGRSRMSATRKKAKRCIAF